MLLIFRFGCESALIQLLRFLIFPCSGMWIIFKFFVFVIVVQCLLRKMSECVIDDWKLKARTVVKLYRKNTNTLVCHSR